MKFFLKELGFDPKSLNNILMGGYGNLVEEYTYLYVFLQRLFKEK